VPGLHADEELWTGLGISSNQWICEKMMLNRTRKSTMTRGRGQSTRVARRETVDPAKDSARTDMREPSTAFDDDELRNWLMECIAEGSELFLCAIAEAAIAAIAEDYLVIRPALLELRRKHDTKHTI
jgi:hypothetical protein